jgi:hypothetical protein
MTEGTDPSIWPGDPGEQGFQQPAQGWTTTPGSGEPQGYYGQPGPQAPGYGVPGYGAAPYGMAPPTHLIWARIAAGAGVLFSLILGFPAALVAISHARKVRPHWESGNQPAAVSESRKALTWASVSTVLDVLGLIVVILLLSAQSASNFNTPSVVASSIKTQLQKRISDPSSQYYLPGLKVTSVVCTSIGAHTDNCVDHFSDGQTESEIAVISANGDSYVTH